MPKKLKKSNDDIELFTNRVESNFSMYMGEKPNAFFFDFYVKKTPLNQKKYWLFCKFFPFKIDRWDDE